jgi:hypothetical protein
MSPWWAVALMVLTPLACTLPRAPDRPAVLVAPDSASRAEVERVAAAAAGVATVTLGADALLSSNLLVLERSPAGPAGRAATGRTLESPIVLELVLRDTRCTLVRQSDGRAFELRVARCVAAP